MRTGIEDTEIIRRVHPVEYCIAGAAESLFHRMKALYRQIGEAD